jgi:hypothetical protein
VKKIKAEERKSMIGGCRESIYGKPFFHTNYSIRFGVSFAC